MKEDKTSTTISGGIGFCGLLTIVFIVLKLLGKITWPWVWVLAPIWIELIITVIILIIMVIVVLVLKRRDR